MRTPTIGAVPVAGRPRLLRLSFIDFFIILDCQKSKPMGSCNFRLGSQADNDNSKPRLPLRSPRTRHISRPHDAGATAPGPSASSARTPATRSMGSSSISLSVSSRNRSNAKDEADERQRGRAVPLFIQPHGGSVKGMETARRVCSGNNAEQDDADKEDADPAEMSESRHRRPGRAGRTGLVLRLANVRWSWLVSFRIMLLMRMRSFANCSMHAAEPAAPSKVVAWSGIWRERPPASRYRNGSGPPLRSPCLGLLTRECCGPRTP
jgi:hypothetical protein